MSDLSGRLLQLKERIDQARTSREQAEGVVKHTLSSLKKDFGVNTPEKARLLLKHKQRELEDLDAEIVSEAERIEKELDRLEEKQ